MPQNLNSENVVLTGGKQTMASWSKVIESYEDVPDVYREFFKIYLSNNQQFPYTLLTPSIVKPKGKTTEKLICDTVDAIHILERSGSQVVAKSYPYRSVYTVEMGNILLYSWLTISGITSTGESDISTIDFNTSSTRHFIPFMNKLRPSLQGADQTRLKVEKEKFDYLLLLNFKFMNFGRSSLVGGETVLQILLQPGIKKQVSALLGRMFQRTISPAHLTILTDRELILIQDVEYGNKALESNYGGIWQYIPLRSIKSVTCSETEIGFLTLLITVFPNLTIKKIFAVSNKVELERLCACFK